MPYKIELMEHIGAIRRYLPMFQIDAELDVRSMRLRLTGRNRYFILRPQYVAAENGAFRYMQDMHPTVVGFIGWLPYFNRQWPTGSNKRAFKEFCLKAGVPTPESWAHPARAVRDYLVKAFDGSFGVGIRGPFRAGTIPELGTEFGVNHYCERFITGKAVKAWYWNDRVAAVEIQPMPSVTGDGGSSTRALVQRAYRPNGSRLNMDSVGDLCAYQSVDIDAPLESGRSVIVDFRHSSNLGPYIAGNDNVLPQIAESVVGAQLADAGPRFWNSIPEEIRPNTLFSIDAVLDAADRLWFLEMNCNPMLHPDVYPHMLEGLFGRPIIPPPSAPA